MRSNTTPGGKTVRYIKNIHAAARQRAETLLNGLMLGLSGRQWTASFLIALLLLPVFSLPVQATTLYDTGINTGSAGFDEVNPPQYSWETAWTKLNVAAEEWETARRAGNETAAAVAGEETTKKERGGSAAGDAGKSDVSEKTEPKEVSAEDATTPAESSEKTATENVEDTVAPAEPPAETNNQPAALKSAPPAPAPAPMRAMLNQLPDGERDSMYAYGNNLGSPVGQSEAESPSRAAALPIRHRAGTANFNFGVPLASLAGRGIDAGVGMTYNSRTWNKSCLDYDTSGNCSQNHFTYDVEQSWIAPGFSTGFGYLSSSYVRRNVVMFKPNSSNTESKTLTEVVPDGITDSDGTRHRINCKSLAQIPGGHNTALYCTEYATVDDSHIKVISNGTFLYRIGADVDYGSASYTVIYPNGTKVYFTTPFGSGDQRKHYPYIVQDRNGNRIQIAYKSDQSGRIDHINDTLNRKIKFYYENDQSGNPDKLVTITIPGMQNEELETVRFYYQDNVVFNPQTGFSGTVTAPSTIRTLQYVYFPATKTGFKYEYHPFFGMIQKISRRVGMTVSDENTAASKTATGTATGGDWTASTEYDYPSGATPLTDAPKYTKRTDDWRGRTSPPMETFYDAPEPVNNSDIISTITVSDVDNGFEVVTKSVIGSDGLIKETSVSRTPGVGVNQASSVMTKIKYFWTPVPCQNGCLQVPNPKLLKTEVTNDAGLTKATEFEYDSYGNQSKIRERDYAAPGSLGTLLRTTDITYETGTGWINANLLGLVREVKVTVGSTVVSKTLYEYDNYSFYPLIGRNMDTPETIGTHDNYYDPAHPPACYYACTTEPFNRPCSGSSDFTGEPDPENLDADGCRLYRGYGYSPNSVYRGNVTKVNRMIEVNATSGTNTNSDESVYTYDIAGNIVTATLSCCQLKTFDYSSDTGYAYPISETKGTSPQLTSSVVYNKYTGLLTSSTDENGITTGYQYEQSTLRRKQVDYINGGYTKTEYSDVLEAGNSANQLIGFIKTTTLLEAGKTAVGYTYFDGRGATLRSASQIPGGQWSISAVEYDKFGRTVKSYNPFYAYSPVGAPPPNTAFTTVKKYDALGRSTEVELQDGTKATTAFSDRLSTPTGFNKTFVTVTDQAGKQRRQVMDSLGRIVRVDEPDTSVNNLGIGPVNAPVQPTAYEYDGNDNLIKTIQTDGTTTQVREFKYNALSRLTHEKQVEATATLDDNGIKQTNGGAWTKVLKYTPKGLLDEAKDARDVKTKFTYDGLNRVKTVVYTGEAGYQTPAVTYTYDQQRTGFFNAGALTKIETAAVGDVPATATEFDYDSTGQVKQQRQSIGTQVYNLAYSYNLAGQLVSETYPSGKVVSNGYDANGRLATVADQSKIYLSAVGYLGKGNNINSLVLGNGTGQGFAYNDRLQLQTQTLTKPNEILQQYDYGYGQKDATNALKNNGKLAQVESHIGTQKQWTQKFDYDAIGRLSEAAEYRGDNNTLSYKERLDYDNFGNLYRKAANNPITGQQSALPFTTIEETDINKGDNRFTSATGTIYDDAGNVTTDNKFRAMSFGYDANGRMVEATRANTPDASSVYDASGQRVAEYVSGLWKFFVYDAGGKMIAEYGGVQSIDEGGVKYPFTDWQGSTRALTSNSGFVQSRQDYTAFGEEVGAGVGQRTAAQGFGTTNNLAQKYAQTERDGATGLDHTWFRKLENRAGRWTSPDPYNGSASISNPQSFNRYSYVENQPTNLIDPSGLNAVFYACYDLDTKWHKGDEGGVATTTICHFFGTGGTPDWSSGGESIYDNAGTHGGGADNPPSKEKIKAAWDSLQKCLSLAMQEYARDKKALDKEFSATNQLSVLGDARKLFITAGAGVTWELSKIGGKILFKRVIGGAVVGTMIQTAAEGLYMTAAWTEGLFEIGNKRTAAMADCFEDQENNYQLSFRVSSERSNISPGRRDNPRYWSAGAMW